MFSIITFGRRDLLSLFIMTGPPFCTLCDRRCRISMRMLPKTIRLLLAIVRIIGLTVKPLIVSEVLRRYLSHNSQHVRYQTCFSFNEMLNVGCIPAQDPFALDEKDRSLIDNIVKGVLVRKQVCKTVMSASSHQHVGCLCYKQICVKIVSFRTFARLYDMAYYI